jgi:Aldo/keto reductase family
MAAVAVNWVAHQPGIATVIVGATTPSQLEANLQALDFTLPSELRARLERASRPERQFPYSFFGPEIQGMIHGGKPVGSKPTGYRSEWLIEGAGAGPAQGHGRAGRPEPKRFEGGPYARRPRLSPSAYDGERPDLQSHCRGEEAKPARE